MVYLLKHPYSQEIFDRICSLLMSEADRGCVLLGQLRIMCLVTNTKQAQVLRAEGLSIRAIAEQMGISKTAAGRYIKTENT